MPERQNDILVNLTAAANDLLPAGAPKHAVLRYTDNYASTGDNDSTLFADSWVTSRDGIQQVYSNCTKPGGPIRVQMKVFFADGISSYSKILDEYFALSFKMGATGIFHVSCHDIAGIWVAFFSRQQRYCC